MEITVIGAGFVGLTHAAVLSEYGHTINVYDVDAERVAAYNSGQAERIERYVNEPGLSSIIATHLNESLFFTTEIAPFIENTDIYFTCVNTPPRRDGSTNMDYYETALRELGSLLAKRQNPKRVVIVNKSTVPVGTARFAERILREAGATNFGVASNPEFLAQGKAVEDSRRPSRVVVGADTEEDFKMIRRVYPQFANHVRIQYIETTPETAEAIKYTSNTLLLTYISFWNGVGARIGEHMDNINLDDLKRGVTADSRIATWGSYVSNGAGGSCFGKDIQSLIYQLNHSGASTDLLQAVYNINEYQKVYLVDRAMVEAGFTFNQKTVALLGLAFKKRTNDMRDASSLQVVESLLGKGVRQIRAFDPLAMPDAQRYWFNPEHNHLYKQISYYDSAREAITGADAIFISTDWEEFRGLTDIITTTVQPPCLVIDGRRMISDWDVLVERGYDYLPVGGKFMAGQRNEEAPAVQREAENI